MESGDSEATETYILKPPTWWRDQVLFSVPPSPRLTTVGTPRTGAELKEWRKLHKLSQENIGELVGVSKVAVSRWESRAKRDRQLPNKWVNQLAQAQTRKG